MARVSFIHLISALSLASSQAGEITIELQPFSIEKSFAAAVTPSDDCLICKTSPRVWKSFMIEQIADHASKANKGDVLIRFDAEAIDQEIQDLRQKLASSTIQLALEESDLKIFVQTSANQLEAAQRAASIAKEDHAYFNKTQRKTKEDIAAQSLKRSEQILANQREELKQLAKMYEADDITENTEEIILVRQQDDVATAEFALRMEILDHTRTLEVMLPRQTKNLADNERDTAIALKKVEIDTPRQIELKRLSLESLKTEHQRIKKQLVELETDRTQFEIKAPSSGFFYHGALEKDQESTNETLKTLKFKGLVPNHTALATFVSNNTKLGLVAFLGHSSALALTPDLAGVATFSGREHLEIPVTLARLASAPNLNGTYRADFSVIWPKELIPACGSICQIRLISYHQEAAIVIPTHALTFNPNGWTVEVKLADGKTNHRQVKPGRVSGNQTEILSGLEVGQVILATEKN